MNVRIVAIVFAFLAAFGMASVGAGHASAAKAVAQDKTVFVVFTHAETEEIAKIGVERVLDHRLVRRHWTASPGRWSHARQYYYVPGRGMVGISSAQRLINEAAARPRGKLIIGLHLSTQRPMTLYTRW